MTDLAQAIAGLRIDGPTDAPWTASQVADGHPYPSKLAEHVATILNAVASGEMIPKADAKLAVAEAYRKAASVAANACLVYPDGGSPTEDERLVCEEAYRRILALADTDALAEVQALIAEARREGWNAAIEAADKACDPSSYQAHHASVRRRCQIAIRALKEETP